jgi:hypothetical protein
VIICTRKLKVTNWPIGKDWYSLQKRKEMKIQQHYELHMLPCAATEAEFLDEIRTKVLKVFLLAIHSHLYSFALRFLFLQTHATSYSFYSSVQLLYTVKKKGGNLIENHTPFPGYAVLVEKVGPFLEKVGLFWKKPYYFSDCQVLVV